MLPFTWEVTDTYSLQASELAYFCQNQLLASYVFEFSLLMEYKVMIQKERLSSYIAKCIVKKIVQRAKS